MAILHRFNCAVNLEIFARILFSRIALKTYLGSLNLQLGHDLPISVNDRLISPYRESFIFTKLSIWEVS